MAFQVQEMAVEVIELLVPVVRRIRARDRSLADQLTRAASSVVLNIGESTYSDGGNRRARLYSAAGSANEVRLGLRVALAWRYCGPHEVEAAQAQLDRVIAILWRLTH